MKLYSQLMAGALLLGLWSCSADDPNGPDAPAAQGDVYASLTLSLPTTRSATNDPGEDGDVPAVSTEGVEYGKDYENNVNNVLVVLAQKSSEDKFTYVTHTVSNTILNQSVKEPTYSLTFQSQALETVAKKTEKADRLLYVFAYCNPSLTLQDAFSKLTEGADFVDITGNIETNSIYEKKNFLMTSALESSVTLDTYDELIRDHNTQAKAFSLGTVKVERAAARYDFMSKAATETIGENQYLIDDKVTGLHAAYIEMNGLALFNEAKEYYVLPRMLTNNKTVICGYETPNSWVVSPNAQAKLTFANNLTAPYTDVAGLFRDDLSKLPQNFTYKLISELNEEDGDWKLPESSTTDKGDYRIWRYSTENTMPEGAMVYGLTTGIVFRGEIKPYEGNNNVAEGAKDPAKVLQTAMNAGETLYAFCDNNRNPDKVQATVEPTVMLGSAQDVFNYAKTHLTSAIRSNFVQAVNGGFFKIEGLANPTTATEEAIFAATGKVTGLNNNTHSAGVLSDTQYGFLAYAPTNLGTEETPDYHYYVYYYYYNRHNDNGMPDQMGIMEFGSVRNNIYKLRVNTVAAFGLPGDVPPPPHRDDETPEVFFQVSVRVLDWVVRVNGIDF